MNTIMTFDIRGCGNSHDRPTITMTIDGDQDWPTILENFVDFLRGAGFQVTNEMLAAHYNGELCFSNSGELNSDNSY